MRYDTIKEIRKSRTFDEIVKGRNVDEIVEVTKYNHNHGADGRFTSGNGGSGGSVSSGASSGSSASHGGGGGSVAGASAEENASVSKANVDKMTDVVRDRSGTSYSDFKKEDPDLAAIKKESGCTDAEAKRSAELAEGVFAEATKKEPQITKDVVDVVSSAGGEMYGLDFRMKQPTSMGRKIASDAKDDGISLEKAAANVKDAVRYTAVFETKDFTKGYEQVKAKLEEMGYKEVRCKNFFDMYANGKSPQKAVQCVFDGPDGYRFEFQFHTYSTQGAKEVNHPFYEEFREKGTSNERKGVLDGLMHQASSYSPVPEGAMGIKSHNET